jgi:hypothetical protein
MAEIETIFCRVTEFDWTAIFQIGIGFWGALVATFALKTWRSQLKAEKHIAFLDELTASIYEYIELVSSPIEMLKYTMISVDSYKTTNIPGLR